MVYVPACEEDLRRAFDISLDFTMASFPRTPSTWVTEQNPRRVFPHARSQAGSAGECTTQAGPANSPKSWPQSVTDGCPARSASSVWIQFERLFFADGTTWVIQHLPLKPNLSSPAGYVPRVSVNVRGERRRVVGTIPPSWVNRNRIEPCPLPKARPMSYSDSPAFQRRRISIPLLCGKPVPFSLCHEHRLRK